MNKRQMIRLAIFLVFIAFLIVYITVIGMSNRIKNTDISLNNAIGLQTETQTAAQWQEEDTSIDDPTYNFEADTDDPVPTAGEIIKDIIPQKSDKEIMAQIMIETNRKTRTFDVMEGVDEKTLKKDVGWLPSSALPGQEGLCILMSHRDTEFKILKYAESGDKISVYYKGKVYNYSVSKIKIVVSDDPITFEASIGSGLVLVTCYPFYYTGSAPKKMVVTCQLFYSQRSSMEKKHISLVFIKVDNGMKTLVM
jgi:sortase A